MGRKCHIKNSVFRNVLDQQYNESARYKLYNSVKGSKDWVERLGPLVTLPIHSGCVNCICWNETGERLLSGSDDQHLIVTHGYNYKILTNYRTSHRANIFSAKFLPCTGDMGIVSCSGDGMILYTDLMRLEETHHNIFNCHIGTTYEIATVPNDPFTFLSCGEDNTVRCFDLRVKEKCNKTRCSEDVVICCQRAVTALTVNSVSPYQLAIGCSDSTVRLYDRRMLNSRETMGDVVKPIDYYIAPGMEGRSYRITSLSFSPGGEDILVSYSSEHLYLFGVKNNSVTTLTPEFEPADISDEPAAGVSDAGATAGSKSDSPCGAAPPVRRLRLRGDWSDTGPDARPQNESPSSRGDLLTAVWLAAWQARPTLHSTLMQRMTDVLSRMLNDPATRAALSQGGEDTLPEPEDQASHSEPQSQVQENQESSLSPQQSAVQELSQDNLVDEFPDNNAGEVNCSNEMDTGGSVVDDDPPVRESVPMDLPLPSFHSTYSSYVKQPSSNQDSHQDSEMPEEQIPTVDDTQQPSTSSIQNIRTDDHNLTDLKDQLSTMCNGFIEKHGTEPVVNLVYSDKGSTASRISMSVGDEVTRASTSAQAMNSDCLQEMVVDEDMKPTGESFASEVLSSPSHGTVSSQQSEDHASEAEIHDDDYCDSDDDIDPVLRTECRIVHPIEKHMDDAIKVARGEGSSDKDDISGLRKSTLKQKYTGHRNARTMIKEATFWGEDYVISGSDCGHVFMWERSSGRLGMLLEADHHVVNCVQPHPRLPILATSGIDYDVKLWAPVHTESNFDAEMAEELMKRNAVMLEETKDTITVPASFMIRMLACLNQIRRGGRPRLLRRDPSVSSE